MKFFDVVTIEEAKMLLKNNVNLNIEEELIVLEDAIGRVLYEDIISHENIPGFNRSTVDGYGIRVSDSHGSSESLPSFLNIVGDVKMGQATNKTIHPGEAIYLPTGAMLPEGVNGVIMIENVELMGEDTLLVHKPISLGENIIYKDDDMKIGEKILEKGRRLKPQDIGVLASLGISKLKVFKKPKFYIISTGDEIVDVGDPLKLGQIRDINGYVLQALIRNLGGITVNKTIVKDNFSLLQKEVAAGIDSSDIVIISGGSSVGNKDFTEEVIDSFSGKGVFLHGISIKPGKPTLAGEANNKAIIGLPGHPVSSMIVFKVLIESYIRDLMSIDEPAIKVEAILDSNFPSSPGRTTYQMVSLKKERDKLYCSPNFGKSGLISLLSKSSGYIKLDLDEEGVNRGELRDVYLI